MTRLTISLLGVAQVTLDGIPVTFATNKAKALLIYLSLEANGQALPRETLAGIFWPDQTEDAARQSLRQTLLSLRRSINNDSADPPYLHITSTAVEFNRESSTVLDIAVFNNLLKPCEEDPTYPLEECKTGLARLRQAAEMIHGPFLGKANLAASEPFIHWVTIQREQFHWQAMEVLSRLSAYYLGNGNYKEAADYARQHLQFDPWDEEANRQLMLALAGSGKRNAALAQYESLRRTLIKELNIEPEDKTVHLYRQIRRGDLGALGQPLALPPHNVPPQPSSFIGRTAEIGTLLRLLDDPACRIITLLGSVGAGKTRAALQAASLSLRSFPDGVFWVAFDSYAAADDLFPALAQAMLEAGCLSHPLQPQMAQSQVMGALCGRQSLVILDGFENMQPQACSLLEMLHNNSQLKFIVTSQLRLNLRAEWPVVLDNLDYPITDGLDLAEASQYEAVQLFFQRARQVKSGCTPTELNISKAVQICRELEGHALSIELAASQLDHLSVPEIALRIPVGINFLTTHLQDVSSRQRSLFSAFEYSWRLLDDEEQQALLRLSQLGDQPFSLETAGRTTKAPHHQLVSLADRFFIPDRTITGPTDDYRLSLLTRAYISQAAGAALIQPGG